MTAPNVPGWLAQRLPDTVSPKTQRHTFEAMRGAHLAREALGGIMALEDYELGLAIALRDLRYFAEHYGIDFPHPLDCDMDENCTCQEFAAERDANQGGIRCLD